MAKRKPKYIVKIRKYLGLGKKHPIFGRTQTFSKWRTVRSYKGLEEAMDIRRRTGGHTTETVVFFRGKMLVDADGKLIPKRPPCYKCGEMADEQCGSTWVCNNCGDQNLKGFVEKCEEKRLRELP